MGFYDPQNLSKGYAADMATQPSPPASAMSPLQPASFNDRGVFAVPKGMFMPDGSIQQEQAIAKAKRLGQPSIANENPRRPAPPEDPMPYRSQPTQARRKPLPTLNWLDTPLTTQMSLGMPDPKKSLLDDEI